jgi:hypothetical protein
MSAQFPCQPGRNGLLEKQPDVPSISRSRSFENRGQIHPPARFKECCDILTPSSFVEIGGKEKTGFVQQHGIDARDEIAAARVPAREVPTNNVVCYRQKATMRTLGAFDSRLLANSPDPFIGTSRRIARPACFPAFKPSRIYIVSAPKKPPKQGDFVSDR